MGLQDTLRKAAGLLVELPPEEPKPAATMADIDALFADAEAEAANRTKTVDEIVRESSGPDLHEIAVPATVTAPTTADGTTDFAAIYQAAALPPAPFSAEQMLDMLGSLPSELPLDTKRQTVRVTLQALGKASGASPEPVVADASRTLAALLSYADNIGAHSREMLTTTESEITELQAQIEEKRKAIQAAKLQLAQITQACETESDRLDDVLEFFSLDVPPSKHAPAGA